MLAESGVSGQVAFSGKGNRGNKPEGNGRAFKIFRVQGAGVYRTPQAARNALLVKGSSRYQNGSLKCRPSYQPSGFFVKKHPVFKRLERIR